MNLALFVCLQVAREQQDQQDQQDQSNDPSAPVHGYLLFKRVAVTRGVCTARANLVRARRAGLPVP